jgi:outer membrane protein assembly factor BamB
VTGDQVIIADARYVKAFDLRTGRRQWQYDLVTDGKSADLNSALPTEPDLTYTVTVADDCVFARLGVQSLTRRDRGGDEPEPDSFLICLDPARSPADGIRKWIVGPKAGRGSYAVFEGTPVVSAGRVYVAVARFTGVEIQSAVACYDAQTKSLLWQRDVCATPEPRDTQPTLRHHLLTLADSQIVYCSHSGAIVALDAATGGHTWSVRYPSRGPKTDDGTPSPRGLAPCVYHSGRILAAPSDFDRILCLDADTGHLLWESTPVEAIHLLGVAKDRLIFTALAPHTLVPQYSIRAIDVRTGQALRSWYQPADGNHELATFGRGLLAIDYVYWPTSSGLYVLSVEDGEPVFFDPTIRGNLAAANGCLIVTGTELLSVYLPDDPIGSSGARSAR